MLTQCKNIECPKKTRSVDKGGLCYQCFSKTDDAKTYRAKPRVSKMDQVLIGISKIIDLLQDNVEDDSQDIADEDSSPE